MTPAPPPAGRLLPRAGSSRPGAPAPHQAPRTDITDARADTADRETLAADLTAQLAASSIAALSGRLGSLAPWPCLRLALAITWAAPDLLAGVIPGFGIAAARAVLTAHHHPAPPEPGGELTVRQVMTVLRCSRETIYRRIKVQELRAVRPGPRKLLIPQPALCRHVTQQALTILDQAEHRPAPAREPGA